MSFDMAAYLRRIGFEGSPVNDLTTLRQIALRQPLAVPFENLDAWLGVPVSLDADTVFDKLVRRRRGGWCFEQNLLLGNALRELGMDVTDLGGRVVWGRTWDAPSARTHRALRVRCEGRYWLADAGFGGLTMTGVLDMDSADAQPTPHELLRLRRLDAVTDVSAETLLEAQVKGAWLPMYRFDLVPQQMIDFEAASYQLSTDPQSRFVQGLIATRPTEKLRHVLRDGALIVHGPDESSLPRPLEGAALRNVLEQVFGLDLTGVNLK